MVISRGLNFPSRFWAKFEEFPENIREFLPFIFYLLTAFVINPINDVFLYGIKVARYVLLHSKDVFPKQNVKSA
jgi:hypothetical protein